MADDTREVIPRTHPAMLSGNVPYSASVFTIVSVPDNASIGTTYTVALIPSNARILPGSWITVTDMEAASETPTLDIGLAAVNGNITSDADALAADVTLETAAETALVAATLWGKQAWEYVSGQTTDPGGQLAVTLTIATDPVTDPGTLAFALNYATD